MKLAHFFLPHPDTHKKAHLITIPALVIYLILFIGLQFTLNFVAKVKPGILGINSSITKEQIIALTNKEREKLGLPILKENEKLDQAATLKAQNMFEENYWAHYSPSGKDPWGFMGRAGYKFTFAGENLARNFYNSEDVVNAWMASPTHKDNLLHSKYQEIGIAVLEGNLLGQPTVLVVQAFGRPVEAIAAAPPALPQTQGEAVSLEPLTAGVVENKPNKHLIDPFKLIKTFGLGILGFIAILLMIDLYIIRRKAVYRITSRNLPHLAFISVAAGTLINLSPGKIL